MIIVGNDHPNQPHGYWKQQFRYFLAGKGSSDFDDAELQCYLRIASYMSRVFDERTAASTYAQASDVLDTSGTSVMLELFDQQLLAEWLNFANGASSSTGWSIPMATRWPIRGSLMRSGQPRHCGSIQPVLELNSTARR